MSLISKKRLASVLLAAAMVACDGDPSGPSVISLGTGLGLLVNINGLSSSIPAALTVTGPRGYRQTITTTRTLAGLASGTYTITAQDVNVGGTPYTASPSSQAVTVSPTAAVTATVTYAAPPSGTFNLRIEKVYLTQSTQTLDGTVPLVRDRAGLLRVFVTASGLNAARPAVRVRLYQDLVLQSEHTLTSASLAVPTAVDESSLTYSWNLPVAGGLIRPGLGINAEVDVANSVVESNEMDNAFSAAGPLTMSVRTVPTLNLTFVPVTQRGNGSTGAVTNANKDGFLEQIRRMHPIASYNAIVHAAYTTTTSDTLQDENGNLAWGTILNEIDLLRTAEHSSRYYYGVAKVSYGSGIAGVAYVSTSTIRARAAMGWDYLPTGATVAAHELGHNWGRNHAPCGGPQGVDGSYPQADGSTGIYGLDVATETLKPPTLSDIMGYCDPKWIGDYTYRAVLNYLSPPGLPAATAADLAVQPCLLIWGQIRNGEMVLEPAFQVTTQPTLPERAGPYSVSGEVADGTTLFSLSFAPKEIADLPGDQKNFVFAVPISDARASQLTTLRLSGRGRGTVRRAQPPAISPAQPRTGVKLSADVRRLSSGGMGIQWNARAHPMVMVRDAGTGEVLSLARGGQVQLPVFRREIVLVLSDGVKSTIQRVQVAP